MKKNAVSWLDRARAAKTGAEFKELLNEVTVRPITERQSRVLRPKFTRLVDGKQEVDPDAIAETLIAACCFLENGEPVADADDLLDLPAFLYQRLATMALSANGYTPDAEGNA